MSFPVASARQFRRGTLHQYIYIYIYIKCCSCVYITEDPSCGKALPRSFFFCNFFCNFFLGGENIFMFCHGNNRRVRLVITTALRCCCYCGPSHNTAHGKHLWKDIAQTRHFQTTYFAMNSFRTPKSCMKLTVYLQPQKHRVS